jgi:hypothetical protein
MKTISTGQPSTLKTYRDIAISLSLGDMSSSAVKFIDKKIEESTIGEQEEVIANESQMMHLIMSMIMKDIREKDLKKKKGTM